MFKGAIFDLDGTLLDSMPIWGAVGIEYLRMKGHNPPRSINQILKTMSLAQSARYFRTKYAIADSEDEIIEEIVDLIEEQYRFSIPLKPGVIPFLEKLHSNNVKMCVATATERNLAEAALNRLGVAKYFKFILTCSEVGMAKDSPEFFLRALELLKTPKDKTIVFEDALHAIKSAKAIGLTVAAVYDESSRHEQEEIQATADVYLNSFENWKVIRS